MSKIAPVERHPIRQANTIRTYQPKVKRGVGWRGAGWPGSAASGRYALENVSMTRSQVPPAWRRATIAPRIGARPAPTASLAVADAFV
jgi:hypothetical protein